MVSPPKRDVDQPRLARREQILEAARQAIEEHGPDALTGQIAERAKLARPNFYRHFSSKDELGRALAHSAYQELHGEIRERLDLTGTPLDVIRAPLAAQVIWADRHPNLYRFLVSRSNRFATSSCEKRSSEQGRTHERDFAAEVAAAAASYFPRFTENPAAADAILIGLGGFIDASILGWLAGRAETRDQLIDRLAAQVWLIIDHHLQQIGVYLDTAIPLSQPERV